MTSRSLSMHSQARVRTVRSVAVTGALVLAIPLCVVLGATSAYAASFAVTTVADTADASTADGVCDVDLGSSGNQCTLRAAIQQANAAATADVISFKIADGAAVPGSDVRTITPTTALPTITAPVTINGYSQPGASANSLATGSNAVLTVELNGSSVATYSSGLQTVAPGVVIKGLIINRWPAAGVAVLNASQNTKIQGNFIGTDASGLRARGMDGGVYVESNATVGGSSAAARNVISGNGYGVSLPGQGAKVQGNLIGTNKNGSAGLGNTVYGVVLAPSAQDALIGGTTGGARNTISDNGSGTAGSGGIFVNGATGNTIQGNYIGTDASGTAALRNEFHGVFISNGSANVVGGTSSGARNVISGNNYGVNMSDGAANNRVEGNYIGTKKDGTSALGNAIGVAIYNAPNNVVGGSSTAARNVISGNRSIGLHINGGPSNGNRIEGNFIGPGKNGGALGNGEAGVSIGTAVFHPAGNRVLRNSIYANTGLGIDLRDDGVTLNDADDPDTGPNALQNFPAITSAKPTKKRTLIEGTLNSTPNTAFTVQLFSSPEADDTSPCCFGEGKTYAGQLTVTTDAGGDASFAVKVPRGKAPPGSVVTATATSDAAGNTSEFSLACAVGPQLCVL